MKKYRIIISKNAGREIRTFPQEYIPKIYAKMLSLADDPRPAGCKKLAGYNENIWRIRVGDYRIVYSIDDVVCIVDIRHTSHRKDIYR